RAAVDFPGVNQLGRGTFHRSDSRLETYASSVDASDAVARGTHDRLDELMIGILVAAIHQLAEALRTVGSIVEAAGEIERPNRVVRGPDGEHPHAAGGGGRVAENCRFGGLHELAQPRAAVQTGPGERVRP